MTDNNEIEEILLLAIPSRSTGPFCVSDTCKRKFHQSVTRAPRVLCPRVYRAVCTLASSPWSGITANKISRFTDTKKCPISRVHVYSQLARYTRGLFSFFCTTCCPKNKNVCICFFIERVFIYGLFREQRLQFQGKQNIPYDTLA